MAWCLLPKYVDKFKEGLRTRKIDPAKLAVMTSLERRAFFEEYVGKENAQQVNSLFESKLLLKNQITGIKTWLKRVTGLSPQTRMDLISRIERMDRVLNPKEEEQFLQDLASTRLKVNVTQDEAKIISDLSKKVETTKVNYKIDEVAKLTPREGLTLMKDKIKNKARLEYGKSVIKLDNYVTDLKNNATKLTWEEFKRNPLGAVGRGVKSALDVSKAMNASYDDSAVLNQGFPILSNFRTAGIWARNAVNTLVNIVKTFRGKPVWDEIRADAVSRPNYINGLYKTHKLAVDVLEEQYPTVLPEKLADWGAKKPLTKFLTIPTRLFGKGYKATEVAFNGFQLRNRLDVFDLFTAIADKNGLNLSPQSTDIEGLGKLVNSLTSRGRMGALEPVANIINSPFFSLRKQVAGIESLFGYQFGKQSPFTRKMGATAALQQLGLIALILGIAKALWPDSVETDPTSSDYGKLRSGSTRFDLTQGRAGYLTLAMRIALNKSKSSTTGEVKPLNTGEFGSMTSTDLLVDFSQNKLSPFLNELLYVINRETREEKKPTVASVLSGLFVPLNFKNIPNMLNNPDSANFIATTLANLFGVQTNIYANSNIKSQLIPTDAELTNNSFINAVLIYAKALGTDPETAFNRIFSGQRILRVTSGAIIVQRMSVGDSQAYKKKYGSNTKQVKLDHTVPLELGGSNSADNLKLVSTQEWESYTKVENALGRALKAGKISKKEAQAEIIKFKKISDSGDRKKYGEELINKYK
jgi:hypothetical protein